MSILSVSSDQWQACADSLNLDVCLLKTVAGVESSGNGFLPDGRPTILFEGHVFWKQLQKRGINPEILKMPGVLYPRWTKEHYRGGAREWERLDAAALVNKEAALCSASWGAFQVMGFNHAVCGFADVHAFVEAMRRGAEEHLKAFAAFLKTQKLVEVLRRKDWAAFAERYNGPGYAQNRYDQKLAEAYAHWSVQV